MDFITIPACVTVVRRNTDVATKPTQVVSHIVKKPGREPGVGSSCAVPKQKLQSDLVKNFVENLLVPSACLVAVGIAVNAPKVAIGYLYATMGSVIILFAKRAKLQARESPDKISIEVRETDILSTTTVADDVSARIICTR